MKQAYRHGERRDSDLSLGYTRQGRQQAIQNSSWPLARFDHHCGDCGVNHHEGEVNQLETAGSASAGMISVYVIGYKQDRGIVSIGKKKKSSHNRGEKQVAHPMQY